MITVDKIGKNGILIGKKRREVVRLGVLRRRIGKNGEEWSDDMLAAGLNSEIRMMRIFLEKIYKRAL